MSGHLQDRIWQFHTKLEHALASAVVTPWYVEDDLRFQLPGKYFSKATPVDEKPLRVMLPFQPISTAQQLVLTKSEDLQRNGTQPDIPALRRSFGDLIDRGIYGEL